MNEQYNDDNNLNSNTNPTNFDPNTTIDSNQNNKATLGDLNQNNSQPENQVNPNNFNSVDSSEKNQELEQAQSQPESETQNKKSKFWIILIIIVVLTIGAYFLYNYLWGQAGLFVANKVFEASQIEINNSQNDITATPTTSINSNVSNTGKKWPADLPSGTPEFTSGKIISTVKTENPDSWLILITEVTENDMDQYVNLCKTSGWEIEKMGGYGTVFATLKKDNYTMSLTFADEENSVGISIEQDY